MGRVSSKMASLVKLRMEKLSSHLRGQGLGVVASEKYSTETLRWNMGLSWVGPGLKPGFSVGSDSVA